MFEIKNNPQLNKDSFSFNETSEYPYFTRTEFNNGILWYVDYLDEEHKIHGNCLAVGMIAMKFFYMKKDFYAGQFTKRAIPKWFILTANLANFFISLLSVHQKSFQNVSVSNFEWQFNKTTIQLPTKNGEIDFNFMNSFVAELEAERMAELEAYLMSTGLKEYNLTEQEQQVLDDFENGKFKWGEFKIGELFDVATWRDVIIGKVLNGEIPLISHQHENNGITKSISQLSNRRLFNFKNTLSLADRGVFLATTQNENFHIGTRVKALTFKDGDKTVRNRLFLVASINRLQVLFTEYSNNATGNLPNLKISLPTQNNQPDYDIMEILISAIQKLVIKEVVLYADRKIEAMREVVGR